MINQAKSLFLNLHDARKKLDIESKSMQSTEAFWLTGKSIIQLKLDEYMLSIGTVWGDLFPSRILNKGFKVLQNT